MLQVGGVVIVCIILVMVVQWLSLRRTHADRHARILEGRAAAAATPQAVPRAENVLPRRSPLASPREKSRPLVLEESTSDDEYGSEASSLPVISSMGLLPRIQRSETGSDSSGPHTNPIHHADIDA